MIEDHYRRIRKLNNNYSVTEDLLKIYHIKAHDYFLRDMKLGKSVSLLTPRIQQDRAVKVIETWYKKNF